ncbi:MAG: hypothetical protein ABIJ59_16530 [Pseudomonadota bacterium]
MKVNLIRSDDLAKNQFNEIYNLLLLHDGPISFIKCSKPICFTEEKISWDTIFEECIKYRKNNNMPSDEYVILLMSKPNENNWFSSFNPDGTREIFIHTGDWEHYISCDSIYAIAFQIVENILQDMMFDTFEDGSPYFHDPAIGCINDMCSWKSDISFKLRTADICTDCLIRLNERGVDEKIVEQSINIIESLRKNTLFSKNIHNGLNYQNLLPFPIAITKRKLDMTIEPFKKFLLLIDHFDSIIRTTVILIGKLTLNNDFDNFFIENNLDDRPSLGSWVAALQKISNYGNNNIENINLDNEFFKRIQIILKKAENEKIVRLRNEERGHGYCACNDSSYTELFLKFNPILECIEHVLLPLLIRCKCYYVKSFKRITDDKFEVRVKPIMGNHPDFIEKTIDLYPEKVDDIPKDNHIYIQFGDNIRWENLHPYVLYDNCPICLHQRVLLRDGKLYIDPYIGHRVSIDLNC